MSENIQVQERVLDGTQVGPVTVSLPDDPNVGTVSISESLLEGEGSEILIQVSDNLGIVGIDDLIELNKKLEDIEHRIVNSIGSVEPIIKDAEKALEDLRKATADISAYVVRAETAAQNSERVEQRVIAAETAAQAAELAAKASEIASKAFQDAAKISETNSKSSEDAAKLAQQASETAQQAAETAKTGAEASAKAAADSAKEALGYTSTTAQHDTNAANSAQNAEAAKTAAELAETNAKASEGAASKSAKAAKDSEQICEAAKLLCESSAVSAKNDADRSKAEADKSAGSAANASTEANRATSEAGKAVLSANSAKTEADRAKSEADRATININSVVDPLKESINKIEWQRFCRNEADMWGMIQENQDKYAASGFVHYGTHYISADARWQPINEGLWTGLNIPDILWMGAGQTGGGTSKTNFARTTIAGFSSDLYGIGYADASSHTRIKFPQAPDGTVTYDSATGAVVKHADAATAFASETEANKVVTQRVDVFGGEFWLEEVSQANPFVYAKGCIQTQVAAMNGIATSVSNRPVTYYAAFKGDTGSKGKGINFFALTDAQKLAIVSDASNNLFLLDNGKLVQWRMRQRTIAGAGNGDWLNTDSVNAGGLGFASSVQVAAQGSKNSTNAFADVAHYVEHYSDVAAHKNNVGVFVQRSSIHDVSINQLCFFHVWGNVPRLNQGAYHPSFNDRGTRQYGFGGGSGKFWYNTGVAINVVADCFAYGTKVDLGSGDIANGPALVGRPDDRFYDAIYASGQGGVSDDRLSAWDMSSPEEAAKIKAKVINGTYRGKEKLAFTKVGTVTCTGSFFDDGNVKLVSAGQRYSSEFAVWDGYQTNNPSFYDIPNCYIVGKSGKAYPLGLAHINISSDASTYISKSAGDVSADFTSGTYSVVMARTDYVNLSVEGNFSCKDVAGNPVNIRKVQQLKNGWFGYWLPVIPDGSILYNKYQLVRKKAVSGAITQVWTDNLGTTWGADYNISIDAVTNSISASVAPPANRVEVLHYTASAYVTQRDESRHVFGNSSGIHGVFACAIYAPSAGVLFAESLIGKVCTGNPNGVGRQQLALNSFSLESDKFGPSPLYTPTTHSPISLAPTNNDSPAVKALIYQSSINQGLHLSFAYKELHYDASKAEGIRWGDTVEGNTFKLPHGLVPIHSGQVVIDDLNGHKVLAGTNKLTKRYGYSLNKARAGKQIEGVDL